MIVSVKRDLEDLLDAIEHLKASLPRLTREEKVDVGARIRSLAKTCEEIDKSIKEDIKTWRKGKPGTVLGEIFKGILAETDVTRLNQKALQEAEPVIYEKYRETKPEQRITFMAR